MKWRIKVLIYRSSPVYCVLIRERPKCYINLADWLSRLYEARQNYPEAIKYYKLAGDWAKSGSNKTGISKEQFYAEAVRVQTLVKTGKE